MLIVKEKAAKTTRRSAGIPAMLAAILTASSSTLFNDFAETFIEIASRPPLSTGVPADDDGDPALPQVHALNCLREIFTNSKFRNATEPWLPHVLGLATTSLESSM